MPKSECCKVRTNEVKVEVGARRPVGGKTVVRLYVCTSKQTQDAFIYLSSGAARAHLLHTQLGDSKNRTAMATIEKSGTVAAAEQLCSMSLGKSGEGKVDPQPENNEDADKNKFCSWCGKESNTVKKCNGCKCVWYCDVGCRDRHRREHKKECKLIKKELDKRGGKLDLGTELDFGPLGKVPPREECPICMRVLPIHPMLHNYFDCCGKFICGGCNYQHQMKSGDGLRTCAFCRTTLPKSEEEILARLNKRVERKDPKALCLMAMHFGLGELGLPVDQTKCIDLLRQSAGLGFPDAQYQLGIFHHRGEMGLEQNEEEARKYYQEAAEEGYLMSRHNLGCSQADSGDHVAAIRHWRLSASGGFRNSFCNIIMYFEHGLLHHGDLAKTLQALYRSRTEMRSEDRAKYIEHLKKTGEYEKDYDM